MHNSFLFIVLISLVYVTASTASLCLVPVCFACLIAIKVSFKLFYLASFSCGHPRLCDLCFDFVSFISWHNRIFAIRYYVIIQL